MGVLACSRENCRNVMCNRHSFRYGYICDECFDQLLNSNLTIEQFMNTDKNTYEEQIRNDRYEDLNIEFEMRE